MLDSPDLSALCASAILDAYCGRDVCGELDAEGENHSLRMNEIASEIRTMSAFYSTNAAESERLELLDAIARELDRSWSRGQTQNLDPYVKLLVHLAHPEGVEGSFAHRD